MTTPIYPANHQLLTLLEHGNQHLADFCTMLMAGHEDSSSTDTDRNAKKRPSRAPLSDPATMPLMEQHKSFRYLHTILTRLCPKVLGIKFHLVSVREPLSYENIILPEALAFPTDLSDINEGCVRFSSHTSAQEVLFYVVAHNVLVRRSKLNEEELLHEQPESQEVRLGVESLIRMLTFCSTGNLVDIRLDPRLMKCDQNPIVVMQLQHQLYRALVNFCLRHLFFRQEPGEVTKKKVPKGLPYKGYVVYLLHPKAKLECRFDGRNGDGCRQFRAARMTPPESPDQDQDPPHEGPSEVTDLASAGAGSGFDETNEAEHRDQDGKEEFVDDADDDDAYCDGCPSCMGHDAVSESLESEAEHIFRSTDDGLMHDVVNIFGYGARADDLNSPLGVRMFDLALLSSLRDGHGRAPGAGGDNAGAGGDNAPLHVSRIGLPDLLRLRSIIAPYRLPAITAVRKLSSDYGDVCVGMYHVFSCYAKQLGIYGIGYVSDEAPLRAPSATTGAGGDPLQRHLRRLEAGAPAPAAAVAGSVPNNNNPLAPWCDELGTVSGYADPSRGGTTMPTITLGLELSCEHILTIPELFDLLMDVLDYHAPVAVPRRVRWDPLPATKKKKKQKMFDYLQLRHRRHQYPLKQPAAFHNQRGGASSAGAEDVVGLSDATSREYLAALGLAARPPWATADTCIRSVSEGKLPETEEGQKVMKGLNGEEDNEESDDEDDEDDNNGAEDSGRALGVHSSGRKKQKKAYLAQFQFVAPSQDDICCLSQNIIARARKGYLPYDLVQMMLQLKIEDLVVAVLPMPEEGLLEVGASPAGVEGAAPAAATTSSSSTSHHNQHSTSSPDLTDVLVAMTFAMAEAIRRFNEQHEPAPATVTGGGTSDGHSQPRRGSSSHRSSGQQQGEPPQEDPVGVMVDRAKAAAYTAPQPDDCDFGLCPGPSMVLKKNVIDIPSLHHHADSVLLESEGSPNSGGGGGPSSASSLMSPLSPFLVPLEELMVIAEQWMVIAKDVLMHSRGWSRVNGAFPTKEERKQQLKTRQRNERHAAAALELLCDFAQHFYNPETDGFPLKETLAQDGDLQSLVQQWSSEIRRSQRGLLARLGGRSRTPSLHAVSALDKNSLTGGGLGGGSSVAAETASLDDTSHCCGTTTATMKEEDCDASSGTKVIARALSKFRTIIAQG